MFCHLTISTIKVWGCGLSNPRSIEQKNDLSMATNIVCSSSVLRSFDQASDWNLGTVFSHPFVYSSYSSPGHHHHVLWEDHLLWQRCSSWPWPLPLELQFECWQSVRHGKSSVEEACTCPLMIWLITWSTSRAEVHTNPRAWKGKQQNLTRSSH
jgi:hypothetical protein